MKCESYSLNEICKLIGIPRSSYLYWEKTYDASIEKQADFVREVAVIYAKHKGIYGAPKIQKELAYKGVVCSVSKVSRSMRILGTKSVVTTRFQRKTNALKEGEKKLIVNLIKDMETTRINQVWTTDITYIKTKDGTFFLITFIDLYSRKVVAWGLKKAQKTKDILEVLKQALQSRKPEPGLIIHSDKGSQFRSAMYREFLSKNKLLPSYTSLNHSCDENANQESFHAQLKKECIYQKKIATFIEARYYIDDYINNFYNPVRLHSSIGYLPPVVFESSL